MKYRNWKDMLVDAALMFVLAFGCFMAGLFYGLMGRSIGG